RQVTGIESERDRLGKAALISDDRYRERRRQAASTDSSVLHLQRVSALRSRRGSRPDTQQAEGGADDHEDHEGHREAADPPLSTQPAGDRIVGNRGRRRSRLVWVHPQRLPRRTVAQPGEEGNGHADKRGMGRSGGSDPSSPPGSRRIYTPGKAGQTSVT